MLSLYIRASGPPPRRALPQQLFRSSGLPHARAYGTSPLVARALAPDRPCCGSSVVEHSIGNGEVDSSILSRSTSKIKFWQYLARGTRSVVAHLSGSFAQAAPPVVEDGLTGRGRCRAWKFRSSISASYMRISANLNRAVKPARSLHQNIKKGARLDRGQVALHLADDAIRRTAVG